jgi:hypothetical protein
MTVETEIDKEFTKIQNRKAILLKKIEQAHAEKDALLRQNDPEKQSEVDWYDKEIKDLTESLHALPKNFASVLIEALKKINEES